MTSEAREENGVVITIGTGGRPVPPDSNVVEFARQIASERGGIIIVTDVTNGRGPDPDGRPIVVNPSPSPSKS